MAEPEDIAAAVRAAVGAGWNAARDLAGVSLVVTAGPTHEPIDPVRFLGNRSSGKMGYAIASEATARGANVTLVSGPVALPDPPGIEVRRVETASEMLEAVLARYPDADAVVMAAAVADFRPEAVAGGKIKRSAGPPEVRLVPTPDILAELAGRRRGQILIGFAAETAGAATDDAPGDGSERILAEGRRKLNAKRLDLLVVNEVGRSGTGFGSDTDRAAILGADGSETPLEDWTKAKLSAAICDRLAGLVAAR
jgi:phosphopantothenoylcysteine decarboxylase/phosphopantothenate--cysteine ligase